MNINERAVYVAIHGWSGAGKTWLAHTAPGPRLVLDTENGSLDTVDLPGHKRVISHWDPTTEPAPTGLKPEDTLVVNIRDLRRLKAAMVILEAGKHEFESVILDSFTEMQAMMKTHVADPGKDYNPDAVFDQQAWGRLKNHGSLLLRDLRDLTWPDAQKRVNVVVVMGSDTEALPARPLLEGGVRKQLPYWFDLVGYLFTAIEPETKEEVRVLQIAKTPDAEAKCRLHSVKVAYGAFIERPDLTNILLTLNG